MVKQRHIDIYFKHELMDSFDIEDEIYNFMSSLKESNGIGRVLYNNDNIISIHGFCENRLSEINSTYPNFKTGEVDSRFLDTYRTYVYIKELSKGLENLIPKLDNNSKINVRFVIGWKKKIEI